MLLAAVASSARLAIARALGAPLSNRDNLRIIAENLINSATSPKAPDACVRYDFT